MTLPPHARTVTPVSKTFAGAERTAALVLAAGSGFLSAFTRISRGSMSVTAPAVESRCRGILIRTESESAVSLTLLNREDKSATVRLWAYDDQGSELARNTLRLTPGQKVAGPPETFFGASVSGAKRFRFYSDRRLAGFALSDSPDRTAFDALPAAPEYFR